MAGTPQTCVLVDLNAGEDDGGDQEPAGGGLLKKAEGSKQQRPRLVSRPVGRRGAAEHHSPGLTHRYQCFKSTT